MEPKLKEDEGLEAREKIQERKKMNGKMDEVYDLLEMLRGIEGCKDINAFLLSMSSAIDICLAMKQSGCLPLLIKLINARGQDTEAKEITSQVFHNIIQATADRSTEQPETRIYNLLEQLKDYCQMLRSIPEAEHSSPEDVNDQPVDYSQKYLEPVPVTPSRNPGNSNTQPIDYSMKYYENDSLNQDNVANNGIVQGTVDYGKRFSEPTCTLHQNSPQNDGQVQPIDYSTRYSEKSSMLQQSDVADESETIRIPKKESSGSSSKPDVFGVYAETDLDQPTDYSLRYAEDDTDEEEKQNSGYFAENEQAFVPEDTVKTYCTEGTPYETPFNFSTATSMSDLRVDDSKDTDVSKKNPMKIVENNRKDKESTFEPSPEESSSEIIANNGSESRNNVSERSSDQVSPEKADKYCEEAVDKEGKMVTFGGEDHYAEETPLMFSRTSSLGSLGGFEQHSIHDDRSSVVSDFSSWRTSGIVSPSELPDSPTQTVPPSPRHNKSQPEFTNRSQDETSKLPAHRLCEHKVNGRSTATKRSVFEDDIAAFKEESTPIDFSAATSLSSLTIDDEPKIANDSKFKENREKLGEAIPEEREETSPTQLEHPDTIKIAEVDEVSEGEDDEGMLDACINIGMQSIMNRKEDQKGSESSDIASVAEAVDVGQISDEHDDDEGMLAACINIGIQRAISRQEDPKTILKPEIGNSVEAEDSLKISDVDSDGEEMLTACINVGIQSIHKQSLRRGSMPKPPTQPVSNLTRYQTSSALNHLDGGLTMFPGNHRLTLKGLKGGPDDTAILDSIHIYCTEDTPANISPAGSHSNLSVLSMLSSPGIVEKGCEPRIMEGNAGRSDMLSIDSLTLCEDDDVIVAKLIESGMRKVQLNGNPACGITLPVSSKTDQERPCRTPSTSPAEPVFTKPKKDSSNLNDTGPLRSQSPEDERRYEATTFATPDVTSRNCKSLEITPASTELRCSKGDPDT
ncbi:adenomatous polyposis coli protein-like isoform X7 [Diprion similis]|uniref:adenomatous polyposis coli protein-like isoform X7 n=1 Tax=Diprion similis TaxID=362088 RepID=UPI001EF8C8A4|nr:adenomatous polyposis coli protein-like isoform X7 [Diprion similis]